jgi:DNA-binding transcriptional LysR family regulator
MGSFKSTCAFTATLMLGQQLLAPVLAEFLEAYPAVELTVQLTDRHVDLVAERFDLAVRTGALPDSSLVTVPIGAASWRLVASPRYLAARGTPQRPTDLASHHCLLFARSGAVVRGAWPLGKGKRSREVSVAGRLVADDMVVLREAAVRGLGIARLPDMLVEAAIDRADLVAVLDDAAPSPTPLQIVHLGGRNLPPRTRAFIEFVRPRLARLIARRVGT